MLLLTFIVVMIYIIHKILAMLKNYLNYLKCNILMFFLRSMMDIFYILRNIMIENPRPKEENIIKEVRNLFRLKKELNCNAIKDIRNLFRREKETKAIKDIILRDLKNVFEYE